MYRVFTNVTIVQKTQIKDAPKRDKTIVFDFVNKFTCAENWRDLTNGARIIVPKNLYVRDKNNKLVLITDVTNTGGFSSSNPLLMRGDEVTIDYGYRYFKAGREVFEGTKNDKDNSHLYKGFISLVTSKKPIEFECEDNMWILKQTPAPIRTFKATDNLEYILKELLKNTKFSVKVITQTTFGAFRTGNESITDVLERLRKSFFIESTFKGDELRSGINIYIESEAKTHVFTFQQNIISDSLEYKRKEDIILSMVASNKIEKETGETNKDGTKKTKCERLEVLITLKYGSDTPEYFVKKKGEDYPPNVGGERLHFTYPEATTIKRLQELGLEGLQKYYYTGFRGKFVTFGIPLVRMGDNVKLFDPILPERNGLYKVKGVEYEGGMSGLRQTIELHYKIL